ncbi:MAG TPA: ferritin-like domain-containing protein [Acidimicrobiales bacterium]|nr:ferritin-like domain-containing protein [Acidimicrobiales bacterium]
MTTHPPSPERRSFLARFTPPGLPATPGQQLPVTTFAAFAAGIERTLVAAYDSLLDRVSEEVRPLLETYRAHHREHAEVLAGLAAGEDGVGPDEGLVASLTPRIDEISGTSDALVLARELEDRMAATYAHALTRLEDADAAGEVASVLAVEASHGASLGELVEDALDARFPDGAFETTDQSRGFSPGTGAPG